MYYARIQSGWPESFYSSPLLLVRMLASKKNSWVENTELFVFYSIMLGIAYCSCGICVRLHYLALCIIYVFENILEVPENEISYFWFLTYGAKKGQSW